MENKIPTFEELVIQAPEEIKDILLRSSETKQSPKWHPEGDVLKHIKIVYERAKKTGDLDLAIAAFFHDLGKERVTKPSVNTKGSWSAHGHEFVSAKLVDRYRDWIEDLGGDFDKVRTVVHQHMRIKQISEMKPRKQQELRDNPYYEDLCKFTECDDMLTLSDDELDF
jgi:CRISPR/Cas system-associated endonuclease Cas3-HD